MNELLESLSILTLPFNSSDQLSSTSSIFIYLHSSIQFKKEQ